MKLVTYYHNLEKYLIIFFLGGKKSLVNMTSRDFSAEILWTSLENFLLVFISDNK